MSRVPPKHWSEVGLLYREVSRELEEFVSRLQGSPDAASDVVQEAFEVAATRWGRLGSLDREAQRAWLFRFAKIKVFEKWRSTGRRAPLPQLPDPPSALDTPRTAAANVLLERCWAAVAELPPVRRRIALLRWQGDWTVREIAEYLGMTTGTVRVQLHRARKMLLEQFGTEILFPSDWWESLQEEVPSEQR
ncbi:RNA polymerase sigma factor [Streptomyces sp. NPDC088847]|uniref:RNA polymerase sigma factor n=1 Tax=Streptomyces sp. NPDC088847 TaxID=3365909 RepID=UPI0037F49403